MTIQQLVLLIKKLVAHNIGQVRIKVYSVDNPNIYDVAIVNVVKDNSLEVEFEYEEIMLKGEKQTINYQFQIDDGRKLTFTTNNQEVIKVDEEGNLIAVGIGEALITTRIDSLYDEGVYKDYNLTINVICANGQHKILKAAELNVDQSRNPISDYGFPINLFFIINFTINICFYLQ